METTQNEIERALRVLIDKQLWTCRRAADMATFQFGRRLPTQDFFGKATEVGDYALHVQCAWRIVQRGHIAVASGDLYYPAKYDGNLPLAEEFDWGRSANRRDALIQDLFSEGQPILIVREIETGLAARFRLILTGDAELEVFPDDSMRHEHWRLLSPLTETSHFVPSANEP
ncbi:MAG TPA: hypothetical protein VLY23_04225 [Candidatus Acidoferrum sp.]|nr:hypothetical protein [Candidatus Acidoferrum sp.]